MCIFIICYLWVYIRDRLDITRMWKSETSLQDSFLSFYHRDSGVRLMLHGLVVGTLPTDLSHWSLLHCFQRDDILELRLVRTEKPTWIHSIFNSVSVGPRSFHEHECQRCHLMGGFKLYCWRTTLTSWEKHICAAHPLYIIQGRI